MLNKGKAEIVIRRTGILKEMLPLHTNDTPLCLFIVSHAGKPTTNTVNVCASWEQIAPVILYLFWLISFLKIKLFFMCLVPFHFKLCAWVRVWRVFPILKQIWSLQEQPNKTHCKFKTAKYFFCSATLQQEFLWVIQRKQLWQIHHIWLWYPQWRAIKFNRNHPEITCHSKSYFSTRHNKLSMRSKTLTSFLRNLYLHPWLSPAYTVISRTMKAQLSTLNAYRKMKCTYLCNHNMLHKLSISSSPTTSFSTANICSKPWAQGWLPNIPFSS